MELELPHLYHSVARNSPKRPLLTEKWGTFQVCSSQSPCDVRAAGPGRLCMPLVVECILLLEKLELQARAGHA